MQRSAIRNLCIALAAACALVGTGSKGIAADTDAFVSGARLIWLHWAEGHCNGKADRATIVQLERVGQTAPEQFADGQRAARRSITQSVGEGRQAELCAVVVRDFGPEGQQLKGSFTPGR